ncbi:MAG: histidine phosphatase family protein [Piscinibacter sp.]
MRLLLVRHGETALNAARILQPADTPLSERGLAQAAALARRLAAQPITQLWSSDLPRAWQTAEPIAHAAGVTIQPWPALQERNFGDLRGRPYESLGFDPLAMQEAPPAGESVAAFEARVDTALDAALAAADGGDGCIVLVSHGLVIHSLLSRRIARAPGLALPPRIANTSVSVVEPGTPPRATLIDCTAHLADAITDDPLSLSGG